MATREDVDANNDDCAICWETMEAARKLPCGHLFHKWVKCATVYQGELVLISMTLIALPGDIDVTIKAFIISFENGNPHLKPN